MARHNNSRRGARRYSLIGALLLAGAAHAGSDTLETIRAAIRVKNYAQAVQQLVPLAETGNADAEYLLGSLYRTGLGVALDNDAALKWTRRAAEHGDADAAYSMAVYSTADTGKQSDAQQWLQRAAKAGHPLASKALITGTQPWWFQPEKSLREADVRKQALLLAAEQDDIELLGAFKDAELAASGDEFGRSVLAHAAQRGATRAVGLLLSHGVRPDQADAYGMTPLMLAAAAGHADIVSQLLHAHSPLNSQDRNGNTALMFAIGNGHQDIALQLLSADADIHLTNAQSWSALDWAMHANLTDTANALKARGLATTRKPTVLSANAPSVPLRHASTADLYRDWPDALVAVTRSTPELLNATLKSKSTLVAPDGDSALLVAVKANNTAAIERLFTAGVTAGGSSPHETPLSYAVRHNQLVVAQLLLSKGTDPNTHGDREAMPLVDAVHIHSETLTGALLKALAKTEVHDTQGRTPLMLAAIQDQSALVTLLLNSGANIDAVDKNNRTALWYAAANGNEKCVRVLLNGKAGIDKHDSSHTTPLMAATAHAQVNAVEMLIAAGASVQAGSNTLAFPLLIAASSGNDAIVRRLLAAGAPIDAQNKHGETALIAAVRAGNTAVVRALLDAGASGELRNADRASARDVANALGFKEIEALLAKRG